MSSLLAVDIETDPKTANDLRSLLLQLPEFEVSEPAQLNSSDGALHSPYSGELDATLVTLTLLAKAGTAFIVLYAAIRKVFHENNKPITVRVGEDAAQSKTISSSKDLDTLPDFLGTHIDREV